MKFFPAENTYSGNHKKEDPLHADRELFIQTLSSSSFPLSKALYTGFTGISPVVAEEICYLSGLESRMTARDMTEEMFLHLYKQFSYYMEQISSLEFSPAIYYDKNEPKEFSALPLTHFSNYRKESFDSISRVTPHLLFLGRLRQGSARSLQILDTLSRLLWNGTVKSMSCRQNSSRIQKTENNIKYTASFSTLTATVWNQERNLSLLSIIILMKKLPSAG